MEYCFGCRDAFDTSGLELGACEIFGSGIPDSPRMTCIVKRMMAKEASQGWTGCMV